ncbi:hypothetical protein ACJX0J_042207, partial [Zea mays]
GFGTAMEEQFILRVPPSVAERIERLMNESAASSSNPHEASLDLSFSEDGRNGTFMIGNESFPVSLLDLPAVVESYKTYDDSVLIKTADVGQMIMVREENDPAPEGVEYKHGLTPPMRDARRRRFRREPDLNDLWWPAARSGTHCGQRCRPCSSSTWIRTSSSWTSSPTFSPWTAA